MTEPGVFTQWSTVTPLMQTTLPGWVDPDEAARIGSYQKYEEIYWSSEEGFTEVVRGDNESPIFMPTARTLVNAVDRYTLTNLSWTVQSENAPLAEEVRLALVDFLTREAFETTLDGWKLYGLIRGDALWHITADPAKPEGSRLRLSVVDPASFFPIYDEDRDDRIIRIHLAEQVVVGDEVRISRQTYEKIFDEETGEVLYIESSFGLFDPEEWWLSTTPLEAIAPPEPLDERIKAFPVYHWKNFDMTAPFGSSELRGLESVLFGINSTVSDEDLTLALDGLGVWKTGSSAPVDEDGNAVDYIMGPGRVVNNAADLERLDGTKHVTPYGDHYDRLREAAQESLGVSSSAIGRVDAAAAKSGYAILLEMGPMLARTASKDRGILSVLHQMFYDLLVWMDVHEGTSFSDTDAEGHREASVVFSVGSKIPVNSDQVIENVVDLRSAVPPVISLQTAHEWMRAAGLNVPPDEMQRLLDEASAATDPLGEPKPSDETDDAARGGV